MLVRRILRFQLGLLLALERGSSASIPMVNSWPLMIGL